jgi:hypothetical protein
MNRNKLSFFIVVLSVMVLISCSGLPQGAGTGGGGNGNTTLTLTVSGESQAKPSKFTLLAFNAQISSLTLNETGGNAVNLPLSPASYPIDFNRLSTDSALLGTFTVPTGTSFSSMSMALTSITITLHNESGGAIGTCPDNAVCEFTPAPGIASITANLFPGSFTAGTATNAYLSVRPDNIITVSNAGLSLVFDQNTPVGAIALPRPGEAANVLDTIEDFTGKVISVSGNSVSITTGSGVSLAAKIGGTATLDDPQGLCPTATIAACVTTGSIISIDGVINTDGSLTANEFDLLDTTTVDAMEGSIFSTGPGTFALVVTDKQDAADLATLTAANIGDVFTVNIANGATFPVDTKNLSNANPVVPTNLFQSSGQIQNGQTVRLHVTAASGSAANGNQTLTTDKVQLRFSRVTGIATNASGNLFNLGSLGSAGVSFFGAPSTSFVVQTFPGVTAFDNTTGGINGIVMAGANDASIRALLINNTFYATKARHQ